MEVGAHPGPRCPPPPRSSLSPGRPSPGPSPRTRSSPPRPSPSPGGRFCTAGRAQRQIVSWLSRDHPDHPPPGELRPQGKNSRFRQQSGIVSGKYSLSKLLIRSFGLSQNLSSPAYSHLSHRGKWVQNSLRYFSHSACNRNPQPQPKPPQLRPHQPQPLASSPPKPILVPTRIRSQYCGPHVDASGP